MRTLNLNRLEEALPPSSVVDDGASSLPGVDRSYLGRWSLRAAVARLLNLITDFHALSIADQAVTSGASFLATVAIAHWGGAAEVGIYVTALSVVVLVLASQEALILLPYAFQHSGEADATKPAGASLALSVALSAITALCLVFVAAFVKLLGSSAVTSTVIFTMAGVVPLVLIREYFRRYSLSHLRVGQALLFDALIAALQIGALAFLGWNAELSAVSALWCLGISCAVSLPWFYFVRSEFAFGWSSCVATLQQSWRLGRWFLANRLAVHVQGYFTYWLTMAFAGAALTGVYAACMSIVAFANPLIFGIGNILIPKSARAWRQSGGAGLLRQALRDAALIGTIMTVFLVVVAAFGDDLMRIIYHRKDFEGHAALVAVLALGTWLSSLGMPAATALSAMERPRAIVVVTLSAALVSGLLLFLLMPKWGLLGAACGLAAGSAVGTVGRWLALIRIVPRTSDPAELDALRSVIRKLLPDTEAVGWETTRLGQGDDATAYLIKSVSLSAILKSDGDVVAKLYKSMAVLSVEEPRHQFDALSRLNGLLHGYRIGGWTICVARPLRVMDTPPVLLMTRVPGTDIGFPDTARAFFRDDLLLSAACAFAAGMQHLWSHGECHRDLGLRNILFDPDHKIISLIDAGTSRSCEGCGVPHHGSSAAATDLGHLLYEHATDLGDMAGGRRRSQRQIFVERVLREVVATRRPLADRRSLLDDIEQSVQTHLDRLLQPALSIRGVWHLVVKQLAATRVRAILDQIRADLVDGTRATEEVGRFSTAEIGD